MVTILFDINKLLWLTLILASYDYRQFCGLDDIYCLFLGSLNNLWSLLKQYGLSKGTNEAMFVIEAYKTLRDRGPYPADQVVKDLDGSFAFVVYDSKVGNVFAALVSYDGRLPMSFFFFWDIFPTSSLLNINVCFVHFQVLQFQKC